VSGSNSAPGPIRGLIVTHGHLGQELLKTAESILGPQEGVTIQSNTNLSHVGLLEQVEEGIEQVGDEEAGIVLLADMLSGSCGQVCRKLASRHPQVLVVSGVNLPMLLEFLYHRHRVGRAELKERILAKGREAVRVEGWEEETV